MRISCAICKKRLTSANLGLDLAIPSDFRAQRLLYRVVTGIERGAGRRRAVYASLRVSKLENLRAEKKK